MISKILKEKNIPSLNGIRGISILMVVISHFQFYKNNFYEFFFNGALGVNIFFVISGFLITILCLNEIEKTGNLSLKNFYIRRFFRIFPVAYLYIFTVFLLNILCRLEIPNFQFVGALAYLQNFSYFRTHSSTWFLAHLWSLSVEEQFYLIFPFLLSKNFNFFKYAVLSIVFILPIILTVLSIVSIYNQGIFYALTHYFIKFQGIAVGCLFAILAYKCKFDNHFIFENKVFGNIIGISLILVLQFNANYSLKSVYANLISSLITAYLIILNLTNSKTLSFRILNSKFLIKVGLLSYSVYIWQQIFTSNDNRLPHFFITKPYNIFLLLIVSLLSYHFYERYFLQFKTKFSKTNSK